jgi:putative transposase
MATAFRPAPRRRGCAVLDIRLIRSRPGKPEGRGKIESFFRTVREQFLVEVGPGNAERGVPVARAAQGRPHGHRLAARDTYQVDADLVGVPYVELVFDPFDLARVEVRLDGKPAGTSVPFTVTRHPAATLNTKPRPAPPGWALQREHMLNPDDAATLIPNVRQHRPPAKQPGEARRGLSKD